MAKLDGGMARLAPWIRLCINARVVRDELSCDELSGLPQV